MGSAADLAAKLHPYTFLEHSEGTAETALIVSIHGSIHTPEPFQNTSFQGGFAVVPWKDYMSNSEIINSQWQF